MSDNKFQAVLAVKAIARNIKLYKDAPIGKREPLHIFHIIGELKTIEKFLGTGDLPSVSEIIEPQNH